ncbi:MAG: TatD family hydrolase, partial [Methylocystis sp.]|nr:TatD family hydrolase [Methylocystis sp.]
MLIDTHCHLDFPDFAPEQAEIVARARARGVGRMITISTHVSRFAQVAAVAEKYDEVYCTVGTHPHHAHEDAEEPTVAQLVELSKHPKCVGLGEAGLDYHYDRAPRDVAQRVFRTHIAAARETGLPLVIHTRDADEDCAAILREEMGKGAFPALLHC